MCQMLCKLQESCNSLKSIETPTLCDHVDFWVSQLFFLPTTSVSGPTSKLMNGLLPWQIASSLDKWSLPSSNGWPPLSMDGLFSRWMASSLDGWPLFPPSMDGLWMDGLLPPSTNLMNGLHHRSMDSSLPPWMTSLVEWPPPSLDGWPPPSLDFLNGWPPSMMNGLPLPLMEWPDYSLLPPSTDTPLPPLMSGLHSQQIISFLPQWMVSSWVRQ